MEVKSEVNEETAELLGGQKEKLFSLKQIKTQDQLEKMDEGEMVIPSSDEDESSAGHGKRRRYVYENIDTSDEEEEDEDEEKESEEEEEAEENEGLSDEEFQPGEL